jgi:hypothetical protein
MTSLAVHHDDEELRRRQSSRGQGSENSESFFCSLNTVDYRQGSPMNNHLELTTVLLVDEDVAA